MSINSLKENIVNVIDGKKDEIIAIGKDIYNNPETGFKEFRTSGLVAQKFRELGIDCAELGNIPGVKATVDTGRKGPGLAILGELDAVICTEHPHCNKKTGAVHACGHNLQISALLGAAVGILESGVLEKLTGKIHFIAVPAEEYIEVAFRMGLRESGVINYLGGKPELLYRGLFDDVDLCIMVHALPTSKKFGLLSTANGCLVKKIRYIGRASHAGAAPHEGINALYAANIGLAAINSIRETFREDECIRVHPIITKGGDIVNVIPCDVHMETFVRGKTMECIINTNKKVNRALLGGAVAVGAQVEIEDIPGYFPLAADDNLQAYAQAVMNELVEDKEIISLPHWTASTDLGDLSMLMPVIQPYIGGVEGGLHSADYRITNEDTAYIMGAKLLALTAAGLLCDGASAAKSVVEKFVPVFKSKQEYFNYVDGLFSKRLLPERDLLD